MRNLDPFHFQLDLDFGGFVALWLCVSLLDPVNNTISADLIDLLRQ